MSKLRAQIGDRKTSRGESFWEYQRKCPDSYDIVRVRNQKPIQSLLLINRCFTFKVFENTGISINTDLPAMTKCQLLTDAVGLEDEDYDDYDVAHFTGGRN